MPTPVSIVIPVWNRADLTYECLSSLAEHTDGVDFEVVIVDNGSTDATQGLLASLSGDVRVIRKDVNIGFGNACNEGAAAARHPYILFLNNDTVLRPGWLPPLVNALDEDPQRGAVQPRLVYPDGRLNDAGGLVFADGHAWVYGKGHPVADAPQFRCRRVPDYASGACLLVRRSAFDQVGGFDSRYSPAYYEDTDLSFALRANGWTLLYEPASTVVHLEGGTAGTDIAAGLKQFQVRNRQTFAEKWALDLQTRPAMEARIVETWAHRPQAGLAGVPSPRAKSILVVDVFPPMADRAGGSLRLLQMVRAMRQLGHAVTCYAAGAVPVDPYVPELAALGVPLYGVDVTRAAELSRREPSAVVAWATAHRPPVDDLVSQRSFDIVIATPWEIAESILEALKNRRHRPAIIADTCDLHFLREAREASLQGQSVSAPAAARRERELAVYRAADCTVCVSEEERAHLNDTLPGVRTAVVGLAHDSRGMGEGFGARDGLVFVGNANHPPNVDAVRWWATEIGPRVASQLPGVPLTVIGNDPDGRLAALAGPHVSVVGWVPDTLPYLHQARVSLAPLRYGAGVKSKGGEALVAGTPQVMTPVAAEGLGIVNGEHGLIAETAEEFADAVVRLYGEEELWSRLRKAGSGLGASVSSLDAMKDSLDKLISDVAWAMPSERSWNFSTVNSIRRGKDSTTVLLVSYCNLTGPAETSVMAVDTATGGVAPVPILCRTGRVRSGLGLVRHRDRYLHAHLDEAGAPHLAVLDAQTLSPIADHVLEGASDPHSLCALDGGIAVASTGTDEVIHYRWVDGQLQSVGALWRAGDEREDRHHINSLAVWRGRLLCSAFGRKVGNSWAFASDGYVADVSSGRIVVKGLCQPHSLTSVNDRLLICDSARGRVLDVTPTTGSVPVDAATAPVLMQFPAYIRGLASAPGDHMYAGTSLSRNRSRSRGVELTADEQRASGGFSGVLTRCGEGVVTVARFGPWAPEVYDILAV